MTSHKPFNHASTQRSPEDRYFSGLAPHDREKVRGMLKTMQQEIADKQAQLIARYEDDLARARQKILREHGQLNHAPPGMAVHKSRQEIERLATEAVAADHARELRAVARPFENGIEWVRKQATGRTVSRSIGRAGRGRLSRAFVVETIDNRRHPEPLPVDSKPERPVLSLDSWKAAAMPSQDKPPQSKARTRRRSRDKDDRDR